MHIEHVEIAERFRGPPKSGNGGYTCGLIVRRLQGPVAVRLKGPPPLETKLRLESTDEEARLYDGTTLVAEGKRSTLDLEVPRCPSFEDAEVAAQSFSGFESHTFPACFVCGPERSANDGLRIFPGSVQGSSLIAAPWIPDESLADASGKLRPEFLWAALDCTGAFVHFPLPVGVAIVLGELAASIRGDVACGSRCVVLGWPLGVDGRKRLAGTAIYASHDRLVAVARAVWIEVPLKTWS